MPGSPAELTKKVAESLEQLGGELATDELLSLMASLAEASSEVRTVQDYATIHELFTAGRAALGRDHLQAVDLVPTSPARPLIDLGRFQRFAQTESSSGVVADEYARLVLNELKDDTLSTESQDLIQRLGDIIHDNRRYPAWRLVLLVNRSLHEPAVLRKSLQEQRDRKFDISRRISTRFVQHKTQLGILPDKNVVVYGYSQTIMDGLAKIPARERGASSLLIATCSGRLGSDLPERMIAEAAELGYAARLIPDIELVDAMYLIRDKDTHLVYPSASSILIGCKIVAESGGKLELVATHGVSTLAQLAVRAGIDVHAVAGTYKIWRAGEYALERQEIINEQRKQSTVNEPVLAVNASDVVDGSLVSSILTENGNFTPSAFQLKYSDLLS